MVEKIWEIKERKCDNLIDQLLFGRGVITDKDKFFEPDFERDLHNPFLLNGMEKAVLRIKKAKEAGEVVGIFSDYDADGIPAAALLYKALSKIGVESKVYIPNRESGYGLSKEGIDILILKKCSLIITADLGIRSVKEAEYCKEKKVDLIVTDHHTPGEDIPRAYSVINPKLKGDKYPFKDLAGCGVIFKLVCALEKFYPKEISESFLKWNLDLVAISTVSDVVALTGENRVLAKYGIKVLRKSKNIGIVELIKAAKINPEKIDSYSVGFQIGPRINAPGRIDFATKSFELLITEDKTLASELAVWLNEKNEVRQREMEEVQKSAISKIEKENLIKNKILILSGDWLKGVIGPSASRLADKYCRPVILFANDDKILTGSARSIEGINILKLIEPLRDKLYKFGGHKGAAGLSILKSKYIAFSNQLLDYANKFIGEDLLVKKIKIDAEVKLDQLSKKLYDELTLFEPFGMGNPKPVFLAKEVELTYPRFLGKNREHFSAIIKSKEIKIKGISFNTEKNESDIKSNTLYDIVFCLDMNHWNGESNLNLKILDLKVNDQTA